MRGVFIDRESRAVGGELEENTTWFFEVHRLEPEAVDGRCRLTAGRLHARAHRTLMLLVIDAPGEMVHRADAPGTAAAVRRGANIDHTRSVAEAVPCPPVLTADRFESEDVGQKRCRRRRFPFPHLRAVESTHLQFTRNRTAIPGRERSGL